MKDSSGQMIGSETQGWVWKAAPGGKRAREGGLQGPPQTLKALSTAEPRNRRQRVNPCSDSFGDYCRPILAARCPPLPIFIEL